jgi:hypothetical protein
MNHAHLSAAVAALLSLVIPLILASGCGESGDDTLILADGSIRTGHLERCAAELCVFDGREVRRANVRYIGLDARLPPPPPQDPSRDEVHRIDKSIHPGPLRSVDAATVSAAINHDRKQVAWIWLTPADVPPPEPTAGDLPSASGQQAPPDARTYEYDVRFHAVIKNEEREERTHRTNRSSSKWTREVTWTGTLRNVRVTVYTIGSSVQGGIEYDLSDQNTRVTETWKGFYHHAHENPVDVSCEGNITGVTETLVGGMAGNHQAPNLSMNFGALPIWAADEVIRADCNTYMAPEWTTPEFTWNGLSVRGDAGAYDTFLEVDFERVTGGLASPVGELVTGRSFTLDTGTHTTEDLSCDPLRGGDPRDAGNSCSAFRKYEQRYVATFTPRR